jgi:chemotaxis protein CheD
MSAAAVQSGTPHRPRPTYPDSVRRFYDASLVSWIAKILPGEFCVTEDPEETLVTILGSCVAACIRDPVVKIGGMNHFMLAQSSPGSSGAWGADLRSARFGNFAMEKLINELMKRGCSRDRLEIKVFGGANVTSASNKIGSQNSEFVLSYLKAEGLRCNAEDLGGVYPRRIQFSPGTGKVARRFLTGTDKDAVLREETSYASSLQSRPKATDIQLFK